MAYQTGIATDNENLLSIIHTFATANGWVADRYVAGDELIMHGLGITGTDFVYVGLKIDNDIDNDTYTYQCAGFTGFDSGQSFSAQPGLSPISYMPVWESSMQYWLFVSDLRIICVAKVSTSYQGFYLGYLTPYSPQTVFPYPIAVGGSSQIRQRYSIQDATMAMFFRPRNNFFCRDNNGSWIGIYGEAMPVGNTTNWSAGMYPWNFATSAELQTGGSSFNNSSNISTWTNIVKKFSKTDEGDFTHLPLVPFYHENTKLSNRRRLIFGELEGVAYVTGVTNAAENVITVGVDNWIVFPNVYRTGGADFSMIKQA